MSTRIHPFEGVENVRDYGGYDTAASRRLRRGRLFRSGHWANATDEDLQKFLDLGVATVVDLRRATERDRQPSRRPVSCRAEVLSAPSRPDDLTEAPHIQFLKARDLTPEASREFMSSAYRRIPYEAPHLDLFSRYFRALAEGDGPVLIHCAAGKDRTGILAALTHRMLGVHADDMVEDYVLTNTAVNLQDRAPEIAERMMRWSGRTASPEAVIAFVGVEPAYLDEAFAEIDRQSGSLEAYFETALGLDKLTRERIAERLLA
ncbi:tyrosine-protein phosphatase [Brevundimonas aveniformis]|uniref:tyrosine-protein phosphatase n=1 Tax=Brevundimonas aveniformis TaxID=370977 RepID=UPI00248F6362|nr:tyrosine-protein phosphatase [Brevundimonas aveniformis]